MLTPVADGTVADGQRALEAAVAAQHDWARTPPRDRGEILRRAFELVASRSDEFASLMSLEMGKTLKEAAGEVTYGNEFLRWFSEEAVRIHGRWMNAPAGGPPAAHDQEAGRAVPVRDALELPARDGHPQDRARRSRPAARWWSSRPSRRR